MDKFRKDKIERMIHDLEREIFYGIEIEGGEPLLHYQTYLPVKSNKYYRLLIKTFAEDYPHQIPFDKLGTLICP